MFICKKCSKEAFLLSNYLCIPCNMNAGEERITFESTILSKELIDKIKEGLTLRGFSDINKKTINKEDIDEILDG